MENIFEGAKFGDKFLTKDGRQAVLVGWTSWMEKAILYVKERDMEAYGEYKYSPGGTSELEHTRTIDIVSRYQEPIDEEKLDELARGFSEKILCEWDGPEFNAFKAGYRKAKEE